MYIILSVGSIYTPKASAYTPQIIIYTYIYIYIYICIYI